MQRLSAPAISVVMSVYNGEEYLAEAVESILGQTFTDFEFIIIDDGSKDRTAQMLAEYAKRDGRIRLVTQENRGRAESLNGGIEMASAQLIARMDADDVAMPERLEKQMQFMTAHPEVGLLGTAVENIGPGGEALGTYAPETEDRELRGVMLQWCPFRHPAIMMRKAAALEAGGYRKALVDADDFDLWLRMAERTKIANLPDVLLRYRFHPAQASMSNMVHQMLCCRTAIAAAAMRKGGQADPLAGAREITAEFAWEIGVREEDVQHDVAAAHYIWIGMLAGLRPDEALRLTEDLKKMRGKVGVPASIVADSLFVAARIHSREGRLRKAFVTAGQAILTQPMVAGRVARMAVSRRVGEIHRRVWQLAGQRPRVKHGTV